MLYLGLGYLGAGIGAGLCLLAAAFGIARLASAALEGTARQPEAGGALRTSMIIPAALIEGLGFFGLVICLLIALNLGLPKSSGTPTESTSVEAHK
ncbi:MAG: ATP synthase F0 subunit C [Elusimicrobia bacterium]|nr:ATP synthase F0 subunit C [Elusimicrobiota bacterium]MBI2916118.1 ATP synthase F0 subunit C [Elusimicrobiota bacterium]MBI3012303.1 ATP synthase F0 subunit C [Elusimicrobiota bacterium]MBI4218287.1 ATP synthase F0 subunit C [Elusimicrobiota bacterium]